MRLLERKDDGNFRLTENLLDEDISRRPYAILSHRWGKANEEVTYEDIENGSGRDKAGYKKIEFCAEQAEKDGLKFLWVDTCCIKKSSDAELSEAVNSMYRWYGRSTRCYVYLSDVSTTKRKRGDENVQDTWELAFRSSEWFSRGWTLQELLAPRSVEFFSREHKRLGDRVSLSRQIHETTGVALSALKGTSLSQFSIDERFRWAHNRQTTREEDWAYSLLGIFDVNIPLIYGEGRGKATHRLIREVNEASNSKDKEPVLEDLLKQLPVANDAPFNSLAKQYEPYCLPETRVDLLQSVYDWADEPDGQYIFWLSGWAGTGKSTIARTVARKCFEQRVLGASFFFARGGGDVGNANKFVTSIAIQLASNLSALRRHVFDAISEHSNVTTLSLRDQWQTLVLTPLSKLESDRHRTPYILVIDALDECDNDRDINLIFQIIADSRTSKGAKLRVFLTSRPEISIRYAFSGVPDSQYKNIIVHDVSRSIVDQDIITFIQHSLIAVAQERSFNPGWPGKEKLINLVQIANGLFIWAATACKFIREGQRFADKRLETILNCSRSTVTAPANHLDTIYATVLENSISPRYAEEEKNEACRMLREVLGGMAVLLSPLSLLSFSRLLSLDAENVNQTLDDLHSVIDIPKDEKRPLRLHHPSFRDFLLSKDRCKRSDFWIDEQQAHRTLAACCLQLMSETLKQDVCGAQLQEAFATNAEPSRLEQHLPMEVQYACLHWVQHLHKSGVQLCDDGQADQFLRKHFLHWLEALGWMGQVSGGVLSVILLESIAFACDCPRLYAFIHDMKRFVLHCSPVIEQAPLQVYSSSLAFAPLKSLVRKQFAEKLSSWIQVSPMVAEDENSPVATLEDHGGSANSLVLSADSRRLVSCSHDNLFGLRMQAVSFVDEQWDACLSTLRGHESLVHVVALSPNDELLASVSSDCTVRLWSTKTGMLQYTCEGHSDYVETVEFSPDGTLVASGSWDKSVRIWNAATGGMRNKLDGHRDEVHKVLFIAQGQYLASASRDGTIRIWDVRMGELNTLLEGHTGPINTLATASQLLASGSNDGTIRLWDIRTGTSLRPLEGHTGEIESIAFSADAALLCSASKDKTVRLWNVETCEEYQLFQGHTDMVCDVKFSPDGRLVASCSFDQTVRIWDVMGRKQRAVHQTHSKKVRTVLFSPDGQYVVSGSDDARICHWDLKSEHVCCCFENYGGSVNTLAISRNGQILASGSGTGGHMIRLWDMQLHGVSNATREHKESVESLLLSPNGEVVASTSSWGGTIRLWDVKTAKCFQRFDGLHAESVVFSPDSRRLLFTSGYDSKAEGGWPIWCFHIDDGHLDLLEGHRDRVESLKISPDGQLLVSHSADQTTRVWNWESHDLCAVHEDATSDSLSSLLPEESFTATWGEEQRIRAHSAGGPTTFKRCLTTSYKLGQDQSHWGSTPTFSEDGQFLATTSKSGTLQVWDTRTGELHHTEESFKELSWVFASDSDSLLSFDVSNQWVSFAGAKIVQIPPNYSACQWVARGSMIVLGRRSGGVMSLSFQVDADWATKFHTPRHKSHTVRVC